MAQLNQGFINLKYMKALSFKMLLTLTLFGFDTMSAQRFVFKIPNFKIENQNFSIKKIGNNSFDEKKENQFFDFYNFVSIQSILEEKKSYQVLPIFCKMEALIYKSSKINLRINLGSNEYVRMLEGKPN